MANFLLRDIPPEVLDILKARAAAEGVSIQALLRQHIIGWASRPTPAEAAQQARELASRSTATPTDILDAAL